MLSKEMFLNQFNEDILNCCCAQKRERYETAAFYRGCAHGMLTVMYWSEVISEDEYNNMNECIRRSITMEDDLYEKELIMERLKL